MWSLESMKYIVFQKILYKLLKSQVLMGVGGDFLVLKIEHKRNLISENLN